MHGACQPTRLARCRHHWLSAVDINKRLFLISDLGTEPEGHDVIGLCRAVPKLCTTIVTGRRSATSIPKLIDVDLSGEIEAVPVPTDGRVGPRS